MKDKQNQENEEDKYFLKDENVEDNQSKDIVI